MDEDNVESVDGTSRTDMLAMVNRLHKKDQEIIRIKNENEHEKNEKEHEIMRIKNEKDQEIIRIKNEKDQEITRIKNEKDKEIMRIKKENNQEIIRLKNDKEQEIITLKHENECLKIKLKFPKEEKQKLDIFNNLSMPKQSKGENAKISEMDPVPVVGIISAPSGNQNQIPQSVNNAHREQEHSVDEVDEVTQAILDVNAAYAGGTQESQSSIKLIRNNETWKMDNEQAEKKSKSFKGKKNEEDKKIKRCKSNKNEEDKKSKRPRHSTAQYENNANKSEENPERNNNISQVPVLKMDTEDDLNTCNNLTIPSQSKGGNPEDQESGTSQSFYAGSAQDNGSLQPSYAGRAQESQSPRGLYTDDACEPAPKLPIISPVDISKQNNPRTISIEEFENVATLEQSEITIKVEVTYDEENGKNMLDTSFCEEVVPSRKNKYGPEWEMMQANLLEIKEEEGSCSDEQNKAVELVAVRHGGGEHKKIKVYNCSLCNREMTNASSIVSHIQSKHAEEGKKKLRCIFPLCEHSATREDLIRHIRAKHTKEELFECKKCSKKFHTYKAMKDHVENHKYQDMCKKCNRFYRHEKCGFCKD